MSQVYKQVRVLSATQSIISNTDKDLPSSSIFFLTDNEKNI